MDFLNTCYETTNTVRSLALYSHLLPVLVALALGFFAFKYSGKRAKSLLFLLFTILLSLWLMGDLITWHSNNYFVVATFWSTLDLINILFYLVLAAFLFVDFSEKNDIPGWLLWTTVAMVAYPLMLTLTGLSVGDFDEPNCELLTNDSLANYKLVIEWLTIVGILILGMFRIVKKWKIPTERNRVVILTGSVLLFLAVFSGSEFLATLTGVYEITLYALFTLPIFVLILTFAIIEQRTFNLRASNEIFAKLLFSFFLLVAVFNWFLADDWYEVGVTAASTVVMFGFGLLLLRSAQREARQRIQIEELAQNLEAANERLKVLDKMKSEFVSIASHQLRSPLTAIRGYASMLLEGSYGKIPKKAEDAIKRIADSSRHMSHSVEDYLNVSRIEAGNMKYEISDFNLKDITEGIVDEMRNAAADQELTLVFKSECPTDCLVRADIGKTRQVIQNLIDNAMKYTKAGTITVTVKDDSAAKKLHITVADTGVGMSEETQKEVFNKFIRAKNANEVNVTGTGLGLFVAKKMTEEMGGRIWAESEGEGKGSTFHVELPLTPEESKKTS